MSPTGSSHVGRSTRFAAPLNHAWPATLPPVSNRGHSTHCLRLHGDGSDGQDGAHDIPHHPRILVGSADGRRAGDTGYGPAAARPPPGGGAGPPSIRGSGRSAGQTVRAGLSVPDRGARAAAVGIAAGVLLEGPHRGPGCPATAPIGALPRPSDVGFAAGPPRSHGPQSVEINPPLRSRRDGQDCTRRRRALCRCRGPAAAAVGQQHAQVDLAPGLVTRSPPRPRVGSKTRHRWIRSGSRGR